MFNAVWQACWPVLLYGFMIDFTSALCRDGGTLSGTFAGAFLAIPVFGWLYGSMPGRLFDMNRGKSGEKGDAPESGERFGLKDGIFCIVTGIAVCAAVNTLIMASPLPGYFTGFSSAAEKLYGSSLLFQAGAVGMVIPGAEELVFRGLVFGGLRKKYPFALAACMSAAVFGIYHGNLLQGIYGFVMGNVLAWGMEKKRTIKAPVLMHMAANLTSVILTAVI